MRRVRDEGGRVFLRGLDAGDEGEFVRLVGVSRGLHGPWMTLPGTATGFRDYLARYSGGDEKALLVCLRGSGDIAGVVNVNSVIRGRFQNASVAYASFAPSAGRGYMTEGLRLVVRYAFAELRLHRLEAQIQPGNRRSVELVRRVGFRYEGVSPELLFIDGSWRDHQRWAITATMAGFAGVEPHPTLPER